MTTDRSTRADQYRIFLLTFWLEDADTLGNPESWRFRLEDPRTGERQGCVGVERLALLLVDQIADSLVEGSISTAVQNHNQSDSLP